MALSFDYRTVAQQVLPTKFRGLEQLAQYADQQFEQACEANAAQSRQSGGDGHGQIRSHRQKIAASLASTSTPRHGFCTLGEARAWRSGYD